MRYIIALCAFCFTCSFAFSQNAHFIYIENSQRQPFSVQVNGLMYEGSNFIIIPKLKNGRHQIQINPKKESTANFTVYLEDEDLGFVLKQNAESNWALFNINTFLTITANKTEEIKPAVTVEPKKTISDTLITFKEKEIKIEELTPIPVVVEKKQIPAKKKPRKVFENNTVRGTDQIYIIENADRLDTVAIFIPANEPASAPPPIKETIKVAEPAPKQENTGKTETEKKAAACLRAATEIEFYKLKEEMENATTDKWRQKLASINYKIACYSCEQTKQLGRLFLSDYYRLDFYKSTKLSLINPELYIGFEDSFTDDKVKEMFRQTINN